METRTANTRIDVMLPLILPPDVIGVESDGSDSLLLPEEEYLVAGAVPQRRREVAAGRGCARRALAALGAPVTALPADEHRVPRWPPGVVGSITHTWGYVAAAVAWKQRWTGVGIDAETVGAVRPEIMHLIADADELAWVAAQPEDERARARTLVFSSKEAAYKCQFPITRQVLDFLDLKLVVKELMLASEGEFRVTFEHDAAAGLPIRGRYMVGPTHLVTAALLASRSP